MTPSTYLLAAALMAFQFSANSARWSHELFQMFQKSREMFQKSYHVPKFQICGEVHTPRSAQARDRSSLREGGKKKKIRKGEEKGEEEGEEKRKKGKEREI